MSYRNTGMRDKSIGQQWHRITHRVLVDFQHRCMRRTAPEEWNLSANHKDQDPTCAEFLRTYMSMEFPGGVLLKRLEAEILGKIRQQSKVLPRESQEVRFFDDLYGFRGNNPLVFLLNPWE